MWHYNYTMGGELRHHGIKGQKWGVRRYQNPDGSLTAAGRKRYYGPEKVKKEEKGIPPGVKNIKTKEEAGKRVSELDELENKYIREWDSAVNKLLDTKYKNTEWDFDDRGPIDNEPEVKKLADKLDEIYDEKDYLTKNILYPEIKKSNEDWMKGIEEKNKKLRSEITRPKTITKYKAAIEKEKKAWDNCMKINEQIISELEEKYGKNTGKHMDEFYNDTRRKKAYEEHSAANEELRDIEEYAKAWDIDSDDLEHTGIKYRKVEKKRNRNQIYTVKKWLYDKNNIVINN